MTQPAVSILIPSLNGWHHLEPCLESLGTLDYPTGQCEVVVIDNASTDDSAEKIHAQFPSVKVLCNETNLGFAPALNKAARKVDSPYLAFLNNDTRVDPGWLAYLMEALHSPEAREINAAAACSAILNWDGDGVQFFGGHINFLGKAFHETPSLDALQAAPALQATFYPCGAGMVIDRNTFLQSGGFDEDYFMIFEDVDLGWRLNIMGRGSLLVRDARIYHHESASLSELNYSKKALWWERNALWTLFKNYSDEFLECLWPAALAMATKRNQILLDAGREEEFQQHQKGIAAAIEGLSKMRSRREAVQAERKVEDRDLLRFFPDPFRVWAYGEPHYELFSAGGYEKFRDECLERFDIRPLFNPVTIQAGG